MTLASEAPELLEASGSLQQGAWLLVALPLLSAAVLLLGGRRTDRWGHLLGAAVPVALFVYGLLLFFDVRGLPAEERSRDLHLWSWIPVGSLQVDFGLLLDPLSLTFVLLITGVGSLIHIYAIGYMEHDPGRRRFFALPQPLRRGDAAAGPRQTTSWCSTSAGRASASRRTC